MDYPNSEWTPGKANPVLTKELICSPSFRTGHYRNVPLSEKKKVTALYGYDWQKDHKKFEYDHLIPLEGGGSNDIENLWPQIWSEAREKDKVENFLHREVCQDRIALKKAQRQISTDWYSVYLRMKKAK